MGHPFLCLPFLCLIAARRYLLGRCGWRLLVLVLVFVLIVGCFVVFVVGGFVVGDVLAVVDDARGGVELLVVGVFDHGAEVDVLRQEAVAAREVQVAFSLGVGGEPVFAVNLLVVGGVGR